VKLLLAVSGPVDWLPDVALAPDHAPEAVQEVALVEDQVSVEDPPLVTDSGVAASDTAGAIPPPWLWLPSTAPPPQAVTARASTGTSSKVFARNIRDPHSFAGTAM
jgi:hypothetical protein